MNTQVPIAINLKQAVKEYLHGNVRDEDKQFGARFDDAFIAWALRSKRWKGHEAQLRAMKALIKQEIDRQLGV